MTKDDLMAKIVWEDDRKYNPLNNSVKPISKEGDPMDTLNWFFAAVFAIIIVVLLVAFMIAPAEAKQKGLSRLEQCQVDYLFCAGRIVQQQAAYNAAVLMAHVCSNDTTPTADYLDLNTLPKFEVASVCQAHLGACGYYLAHWENVLKAKYAEVRAICK
jgi:hypothetical protein